MNYLGTIKPRLETVLIVILLTGLFLVPVNGYAKSDSIKIMEELKNTPFYNQEPIYRKILADTSVLKHKGLANQILKIGQEKWLEEFHFVRTFGNKPTTPGWKTADVDIDRVLFHYVAVLSEIPPETQGDFALELKMFMQGNAPAWYKPILEEIKATPESLRILVRPETRIEYKYVDQDIEKGILLGGRFGLYRVLYECFRFHNERLPDSLRQKVKRWSKETIKAPRTSLALKYTATAILLDEGFSESFIKQKFDFDESNALFSETDWTVPELAVKSIQMANKIRSEYPLWPIDK